MAKWRCKVCGYEVESDTVPETCPICMVGADQFEKIEEAKPAPTAKNPYAGTKTEKNLW